MKTNIIIILAVTAFLTACSDDDKSNSASNPDRGSVAADTQGLDLTGTWQFAGVRCVDPTFQTVTAEGAVTTSATVNTIVIQGNQLTSENVGSDSCKVVISRSIIANLQNGTANEGSGSGILGATTASVTPPPSCSLSVAFDMTQGEVTPSAINETYTHAEAVPQETFEFLISASYMGLATDIKVVGRATDLCFLLYQKIL